VLLGTAGTEAHLVRFIEELVHFRIHGQEPRATHSKKAWTA
jgi:hypothetical protein